MALLGRCLTAGAGSRAASSSIASAPIASTSAPAARSFSSTPPAAYNRQRVNARRRKRSPMAERWPNSQPRIDAAGEFKTYVPHTPSQRHTRLPNHPHLFVMPGGDGQSRTGPHGPIRALTIHHHEHAGRNSSGKITVNGRGGGHKRRTRLVDVQRTEAGEQDVVRIEYDPGRTAHIALLRHRTSGSLSYILAPDGLRAGDIVQSWHGGIVGSDGGAGRSQIELELLRTSTIKTGNCLQLRDIPIGTTICCISLHHPGEESDRLAKLKQLQPVLESPSLTAVQPGSVVRRSSLEKRRQMGGMLCRAAGSSATLQGFENAPSTFAQVKLPSGEVRRVDSRCTAVIGAVSNHTHQGERLGKAGRNRHKGRRPKGLGIHMAAARCFFPRLPRSLCQGKTFGVKAPVSRTHVLAKGGRTRRPGFYGNREVVIPRPRGRDLARLQNQKPSTVRL